MYIPYMDPMGEGGIFVVCEIDWDSRRLDLSCAGSPTDSLQQNRFPDSSSRSICDTDCVFTHRCFTHRCVKTGFISQVIDVVYILFIPWEYFSVTSNVCSTENHPSMTKLKSCWLCLDSPTVFVFFPSCRIYLLKLFGWFLNGKCIGINFWWLIFEHGNIGLVDVSWKKRPQSWYVSWWWPWPCGWMMEPCRAKAWRPQNFSMTWRRMQIARGVIRATRPEKKHVSDSVFLKLSRGEGKVQENMHFLRGGFQGEG